MVRWRISGATGSAVVSARRAMTTSQRRSSLFNPMTLGMSGASCWRSSSGVLSLTRRATDASSGCVQRGWSLHRSPARYEAISMKQAPRLGLRCLPRPSTGMWVGSGVVISVGTVMGSYSLRDVRPVSSLRAASVHPSSRLRHPIATPSPSVTGRRRGGSKVMTTRTAVVVGASMAGLLAARILSEHVDHVEIVERDHLDDLHHVGDTVAAAVRGVPQGRHAHALLAAGQIRVASWFPGIIDELEQAGAVRGPRRHGVVAPGRGVPGPQQRGRGGRDGEPADARGDGPAPARA